ncbi:MAG: helix-turn-helix domain-containing protein [Myxococcota bacterium]
MGTEKTTSHPSEKPRGREAVVEAILQAGAELFAERGPGAASNREIAERAGVNYGLIHRHFGSRDDLVRAVMTRMAADFRTTLEDAIGQGQSPLQAASEHPAYARALARAALDGVDLTTVQDENPTIGALLEIVAAARPTGELSVDDRVIIAMISASVLGWAVFGDFLGDAVGLDDAGDIDVAERIETMVTRLLSE